MNAADRQLRVLNALRRRAMRLRALALRLHPGMVVGQGVLVGRGVRLRVRPGGRVVLGDGCEVDDGTTLAAGQGGEVSIGAGAFIGHRATLAAVSKVTIGPGTFVAELVSIRDHDHDPALAPSSPHKLVADITIGANCWLASKVTVTRGVTVGDGTVVGANAVVTHSLPPGVVAVGAPARATRATVEPPPSA